MHLRALRLICLSTLGLSFCLGNCLAMAETNGVVIPTTSGSSSPNTSSPNTSTSDTKTRFSCQLYNGVYTVMYQPQSQPDKYFTWATPSAMGGGWDAQKRCTAIASRLESYRPNGLELLQTGRENNENIICVTTQSDKSCRIVLTVPRTKDPIDVRNRVFQNLTTADKGQSTTAVDTFASNGQGELNDLYKLGHSIIKGKTNQISSSTSSGINLQPFLDKRDGGNGTRLSDGVAIHHQSSQRGGLHLNPQQFR